MGRHENAMSIMVFKQRACHIFWGKFPIQTLIWLLENRGRNIPFNFQVVDVRVIGLKITPETPQTYLLTCPLPNRFKHLIPTHVSLVEKSCDKANNLMRVTYNTVEQPKNGFAVCVKRMVVSNVDIAVRLAEWIELIAILGANKIFFYVVEIEPKMQKVS